MAEHVFVGFGFGPIQAGLFAKEAYQSGNFNRIAIAEIDAELVEAVRANNGTYYVNVASSDGLDVLRVDHVELLNPAVDADRDRLADAMTVATEMATCLPSVNYYDSGSADSVAALMADGLSHSRASGTIIYAAENNNHAGELLQQAVAKRGFVARGRPIQFLNTVIGKMSRVVTNSAEIAALHLAPIAPGIGRAFLVEQFNKILVTKVTVPGFVPGIEIFLEKDDLLPFEEAKLYGHNAIHALLGFVGAVKGYVKMTEVGQDAALMELARRAFLEECGAALVRKYASLREELFTEARFREYSDDLLCRMVNPHLGDTVARASRDVVRKLSATGRIFGTMALALEQGVEPERMSVAAIAGVTVLQEESATYNLPQDLCSQDWRSLDAALIRRILRWVWRGQTTNYDHLLLDQTHRAIGRLARLVEA